MDLWLPGLGTHKTSSRRCMLCYQAEVSNWDDKRLPAWIAGRLTFFNITVTCCYIKYHPLPHDRLLYSHWYMHMYKPFCFLHPPPLPPEIVNNLPCSVYSYFVKYREKRFHCSMRTLGSLNVFELLLNCLTSFLFNLKCTRIATYGFNRVKSNLSVSHVIAALIGPHQFSTLLCDVISSPNQLKRIKTKNQALTH